jgi:molybdopterin converting factor small subunit
MILFSSIEGIFTLQIETLFMKLAIRLLPPYSKKNEKNEHFLELPAEAISLGEFAGHLSVALKDLLQYPLFDKKGLLTAEFMVNGKHQALDYQLKDGDRVSIIPYICGG